MTDAIFTDEIEAAVIAVLKGGSGASHIGGLPSCWFSDAQDGTQVPLKVILAGDLADHPRPVSERDEGFLSDIRPGILVRAMGARITSGRDGVDTLTETVRVVHVRGFDECRTASGGLWNRLANARPFYAKRIHRALFHDPKRRLGIEDDKGGWTYPSLTSADGAGAQIVGFECDGWDLGYGDRSQFSMAEVSGVRALGLSIWAIGCEVTVTIHAGGAAA